MKRAWISPQRTIQELVCLFSFFLDMGKKKILKVSRGFSRPGHHQQTQHKAEVPQTGAGGCCLHPASPFLPVGWRVSSKSPSCFSLKQERFPGHCPELNSLGSDKKNPSLGSNFIYQSSMLSLKSTLHLISGQPSNIYFLIVIICSSSSVPTNRKPIIHGKVTARCKHGSTAAPAACCGVQKASSPC